MSQESTVIKVDGMSCQGCVKNVTGVLCAIDGVAAAQVSLEAGEAAVQFDSSRVSRDALCLAIEDAGFDAR
jgi:copper chaperone